MPQTGCWAWPLTCCCRETSLAVASTWICWSAPGHRPVRDSPLAARFAATRALRYALAGQASEVVTEALAARAIQEQTQVSDDWIAGIPMMLLRAYTWLEDLAGVDREAAAALASPALSEPVKLVQVPGAQALAWLESGHLAQAADAAGTAAQQARRLGFEQHFFAVDSAACPGRPGAGEAGPGHRRAAHRAGALGSRSMGGPRLSSSRCSTGPRSGPAAGRSATRWPPSRRPA